MSSDELIGHIFNKQLVLMYKTDTDKVELALGLPAKFPSPFFCSLAALEEAAATLIEFVRRAKEGPTNETR